MTKLTKAQQKAVADIGAGRLSYVESGTRRGRTVISLIERGIVGAKSTAYLAADTGPLGGRIPSAIAYNGLYIA